jgi:hypothetical protein
LLDAGGVTAETTQGGDTPITIDQNQPFADSCSATGVMSGQRQPDGRSLRAMRMAWLTPSGKQRCRHGSIF